MTALFSFLGTGDYQATRYAYDNQPETFVETPFIAAALAKLEQAQDVVIFATDKAKITKGPELIQTFQALALPPPLFMRLADGRNTAELWHNFEVLRGQLANYPKANIVFDITHGFRHQSFFAAAVLGFDQGLAQTPRPLRVVYGAWEARDPTTNRSPIWDLTAFVELNEWSNALGLFMRTGVGSLAANKAEALGRRLNKDWVLAGQQGDRPRIVDFAKALRAFTETFSSVRIGELLLGQPNCGGKKGNGSCVQALLTRLEQSRTEIVQHIPPLAELLDAIKDMLEPLAIDQDHLADAKGMTAIFALANLYFQFQRCPEAAITLREAWVTAYSDVGGACPGDANRFDDAARSRAEWLWNTQEKQAQTLANIRNDIEHGGFRKHPQSPKALSDQMINLLVKLANQLDDGSLPINAAGAALRGQPWMQANRLAKPIL